MATSARKLTLKALCGDIKAIVKSGAASKKPLPIARIVGSINRCTKRVDQFDQTKESVCFVGQFRGQNLLNDDIQIDSNRCFLPVFLVEMLLPVVEESDGNSVEFAVEILLAENDKSPVGYNFDARSLMDAVPNQTLDRLMNTASQVKAIAAPKPPKK